MINVGNNGKKLQDAFQQIQDELRTQYNGTYTPMNNNSMAPLRHVAVSCGEGTHVGFARATSRRARNRKGSKRL